MSQSVIKSNVNTTKSYNDCIVSTHFKDNPLLQIQSSKYCTIVSIRGYLKDDIAAGETVATITKDYLKPNNSTNIMAGTHGNNSPTVDMWQVINDGTIRSM